MSPPSGTGTGQQAMRGVGVVPVWGCSPAAFRPRREQPISSAADRVDQGKSPSGIVLRSPLNDRSHRHRPHREGGRQSFAVPQDHPLDLVGGEQQQPTHDPPRAPPDVDRRPLRGPFVPAQLSLDRPEVIDPGLDFDDDQRPGPRIEGEQIDPSVRAPLDDLDFAAHIPASRSQSTIDIARASGVDEVALPWRFERQNRPRDELDIQPKRDPDAIDEVERWVHPSRLDGRDVSVRDPDRGRQFPL